MVCELQLNKAAMTEKRREGRESFLKNVAVDMREQGKRVLLNGETVGTSKAQRRKRTWLFTEVQEYRNYWILTAAAPDLRS